MSARTESKAAIAKPANRDIGISTITTLLAVKTAVVTSQVLLEAPVYVAQIMVTVSANRSCLGVSVTNVSMAPTICRTTMSSDAKTASVIMGVPWIMFVIRTRDNVTAVLECKAEDATGHS